MKAFWAVMVLFSYPGAVLAQQAEAVRTISPNYFFSVFAGLALSVGFLFVLTSLAAAGGITVVGDLRKRASSPKRSSKPDTGLSDAIHGGIRTVTRGIGIAALASTTIVLFFASWLAVEVSQAPTMLTGAIIGLTIWGIVFFLMTVFESIAMGTLIGSIYHATSRGIRQASSLTGSILGKSREDEIVDTAEKVAKKVREELFQDLDTKSIRRDIQHWVNQLEPKLDPKTLIRELGNLFNETELRAIAETEDPLMDRQAIIASLHTTDGFSKEQAEDMADHIQNVFNNIKQDIQSGKEDAVTERIIEGAGLSREDAEALRKKVEEYLRSTSKEELNPDSIRHTIEQLFLDPKAGIQNLKSRLGGIDSNTIASVIAQRTDMSQDEVKRYVDRVSQVINTLRSSAPDLKSGIQQARISALRKFREYLNELGRRDTRFEGIEDDIERLFQTSQAGTDSLMHRLQSIDRESLKSMLASRADMSGEDVERIIRKVESVRDQMISRAQQFKEEVEHRVEQAKQETIKQAEEIRRTFVLASWWVFATLLVSGAAAALGGMMAFV